MSRDRSRPTTVYDVAEAAGVAVSTVSRAFRRPASVAEHTRNWILQVANDLGYQPKRKPSGSGRTAPTIALLVPDITNPFFFGLIRGAEQHAAAAGFTLILADMRGSPAREEETIQRLGHDIDGLILASSRVSGARLGELVQGLPVVTINRQVRGVPCVVIDDTQGMRQAAEHLAALGHHQIAYLAGPSISWSERIRWRGLDTASRELGLTCDRLGPFPGPAASGGGRAADVIARTRPTAVVTFNAVLALGTLTRLREHHITVPDDISVIGGDDVFGVEFSWPPLTTLSADVQEAGQSAVDMLLATIRSPDLTTSERAAFPSYLRVRSSTARVAAD